MYFLEKESRTKDLLFQSVLSYAKMNEVREILEHETFLRKIVQCFSQKKNIIT